MPRCLVLGVNGQDGSFLAESLLRRGHEVIGAARNEHSRYVAPASTFRYVQLDLRDEAGLAQVLRETIPDMVFHVAAVHGPSGFQYEPLWREMLAVNVGALHTLLEHARVAAPRMRVVYAGSAKIFPLPLVGRIDETTAVRATCLYSIGKIASRDLIGIYRRQHGINATNLVLFNHKSQRRSSDYLLPSIAGIIARAAAGESCNITVKGLDFWIDWSSASELMDIVVDIAEKCDEEEFVVASGTTWHGRAAVDHLFARYGLDARRHVFEAAPLTDPGPAFHVALDRLEHAVGRRPLRTIDSIVHEMIVARRDAATAAVAH